MTGQGQKVNIGFKVDLDVTHRFVAKVALSAGYLVYGDHFRKHEDFRKIMNQRPTEMGDLLNTIEAHYDDRFLEPQSINQNILRMMMTGFGPHSAIALIPNSSSLSVVVSVLGDYIGMLSVPADTKTFPNTDEYRKGQFFVLNKPVRTRDSIWNLNQRMLARLEEFLSKSWSYPRDSKVRDAVLARAKGRCEFCGAEGFLNSDGSRYLETHHIIALAAEDADRLTNVIGLCPNDHREAHFGERRQVLEQQMIARLATIIGGPAGKAISSARVQPG